MNSPAARMPEPDRRDHDLVRLTRDAVLLQEGSLHGARLVASLPEGPLVVELDATMISQALTNLIKNAGEAIESLQEKGAPEGWVPEVRVAMEIAADAVTIRIADNGIGLPEDRARLLQALCDDAGKGHRPRPAHREEDHRGAWRHAHSDRRARLLRYRGRPSRGARRNPTAARPGRASGPSRTRYEP